MACYTSAETHYSIFKAARYYKMDCEAVPTLPMGEIDYDSSAGGSRPTAGARRSSTLTSARRSRAPSTASTACSASSAKGYEREDFHIHCDGALFAMMLPFVDFAPRSVDTASGSNTGKAQQEPRTSSSLQVSFERPIDSIAVSGHKMLGSPMPCGVTLTRASHVKKVEQRIDYLNSVDTTIMGSRNGQAALFMWHALRRKGVEGITREVRACLETASYLRDRLRDHGIVCRLNDLSTVVLERPADELRPPVAARVREDIAHVVVMPNVTARRSTSSSPRSSRRRRRTAGRRAPRRSPLAMSPTARGRRARRSS